MALALHVASAAVAAWLFYLFLNSLLLHRRRSIMKRQHKCLPAPTLSQIDPFLGTDIVIQNTKAGRENRFLELLKARHDKGGRTYTTNTYFRKTFNTVDPDVIREVLSLHFNDFGMGPLRQRSAAPLLGQGIFTTDNEVWAHQRAVIRPSLARAQVTDFSIYEKHVDQLISLIDKSNGQVDLQPLFVRLVCNKGVYSYSM